MKNFKKIFEDNLYKSKVDIKKILDDLKKYKLLTGPIIGSVAYAILMNDYKIDIGDIDILGDIPKVKKLPDFIEKGYIVWVYHFPDDGGSLQFEYMKILKFNGKRMKLNFPTKIINKIEVMDPKDWIKNELNKSNPNIKRIKKIKEKYKINF